MILLLSGCGSGVNKYKDPILYEIIKSESGVNLKPVIDSLALVNKYTVEEITKYWIEKEGFGGNIDTLISRWKNIQMDKNHGQYPWFKWEQGRIKELKSRDKNEVLYEVVKTYFHIEMTANKTKSSAINYYIMRNDMVAGMISETDFQNTLKIVKNPIFAYEYCQFKYSNSDLQ
jgi:hypothetical protein